MANVTVVRTLTENEVYTELNSKMPLLMPLVFKTTSASLQLSDSGKMLLMGGPSGNNNVGVPNDSNVNFPIGAQIVVLQTSANQVNFVPTVPAQINSSIGLKLRGPYSSATLIKIAANSWVVVGDLVE